MSQLLPNYQLTFTQGLIVGQLSVLTLLGVILKYLFLDSTQYPFETASYHPRVDSEVPLKQKVLNLWQVGEGGRPGSADGESAEWFNMITKQLMNVYRSKLCGDLLGAEGEEVARKRIEEYANFIRPPGFIDHIKIHAVDLGVSAPRLSGARKSVHLDPDLPSETEFDIEYIDSVSVSLSTSYLFNYPMPSFARLPVSLTLSLSLFKSSMIISPPSPLSHEPHLTISISPDFVLNLKTTSLMGSRTKLANVPKLHELLEHQLHRVLATKLKFSVPLPGLTRFAAPPQEQLKPL